MINAKDFIHDINLTSPPRISNIPELIRWKKGMPIGPIHFQQLTLRNEELLQYLTSMNCPYNWGICKLSIDTNLLFDGILHINNLEAIMPDGLVVHQYDTDNYNRLRIDLKKGFNELKYNGNHSDNKDKLLTIYLASYKIRNTDNSYVEIPDRIERLRPKIFLTNDNSDNKYLYLPIAKVKYEKTYELYPFIPPVIYVSKESTLGNLCQRVSNKIRKKVIELTDKEELLLETKFYILGLVSGLSYFEAVLNTGRSNPYHLYLALCSLVGSISSLGLTRLPPIFEAYKHDNLLETFIKPIEFIFKMINEVIIDTHKIIPFDCKNGKFYVKLRRNWLMHKNTLIGVKLNKTDFNQNINKWINEIHIGIGSDIDNLRKNRNTGYSRRLINDNDEINLRPPKGEYLFYINDINFDKQEEYLHIFHPDPANKYANEFKLYIPKKRIIKHK